LLTVETLSREHEEISKRLHQYQIKYSGENTLENLKNSINNKENEIQNLL